MKPEWDRGVGDLPMAIPAMAPPDNDDEWCEAAGEALGDEVGVVVVEVAEDVGPAVTVVVVNGSGSDSLGQLSPGRSMNDELAAYAFWTSSDTLAFGLMTPTI
jgi:hypothetical protein